MNLFIVFFSSEALIFDSKLVLLSIKEFVWIVKLRRESLKLPAEIESLACTRVNVMFHDVFNRRNCPCRFAHALTRIDDKH